MIKAENLVAPTGIKIEGRKSIAEERPETVELARWLVRARPNGGKRSLRKISAALADEGHTTKTGKPYAPTAVKNMLGDVATHGRRSCSPRSSSRSSELGGLAAVVGRAGVWLLVHCT
jgi:hypothetical protein